MCKAPELILSGICAGVSLAGDDLPADSARRRMPYRTGCLVGELFQAWVAAKAR